MLSYLCRPLKYLLSCLQDGVQTILDYEASYGPTKCPPLPCERLAAFSQQSKACEGLWSGGEGTELCKVPCSAKLWGPAPGGSSRGVGGFQSKQLREEGAAAVLEAGWAQGGCSSNQCCAWTQQPRFQTSTEAVSTRSVGSWGVGGHTAPSGVSPSVLLRTKTNPRQGNPNAQARRNLQKQDYFVRCGIYGGFHWLCFKTFLLLRDLLLRFESPHGPDKHLGGLELELWQTRIDWQYFHLGWHLSDPSLRTTFGFYFQCQGKNNVKESTQTFQSSCTLKYA